MPWNNFVGQQAPHVHQRVLSYGNVFRRIHLNGSGCSEYGCSTFLPLASVLTGWSVIRLDRVDMFPPKILVNDIELFPLLFGSIVGMFRQWMARRQV